MKPSIRWLVPIDGETVIVRIAANGIVEVACDRPTVALGAEATRHNLTPIEACQLGQALLDASREAGCMRAKRKR